MINVEIPSPGESITQVQLASWLVKDGDYVQKDDEIAELDSDKASLSISAEESGNISLKAEDGNTLDVGTIVAKIDTEAEPPKQEKQQQEKQQEKATGEETTPKKNKEPAKTKVSETESPPDHTARQDSPQPESDKSGEFHVHVTPLAQQILKEKGINPDELGDNVKQLKINRSDVESAAKHSAGRPSEPSPVARSAWSGKRQTRHENMSMLRKKVTERMVSVKNETAMLTTFNEINMESVMQLRNKHKAEFQEKFGIKPGFMSFFTMAAAQAL